VEARTKAASGVGDVAEGLSGALTGVLEAEIAREAAKVGAKTTELEELEEYRKVLEEKKKIRDLEKELFGASPPSDDGG
jgi:hypothetical protein